MAQGVAVPGYRMEVGKDSLFEIAGVPEKVIDALSLAGTGRNLLAL
ncbi:MAG: hypothetical protein P8Y58_09605 [Novosphingobium sp.]